EAAFATIEDCAYTMLWIAETVVSAPTLKAGVAWFLAGFETPEVRLEGALYPHDYILQNVRVDFGVSWARSLQFRQRCLLLVVGGAPPLAALPPRLAPFASDVVERPATRQDQVQCVRLRRGGNQPVLERLADGFAHISPSHLACEVAFGVSSRLEQMSN